MKPKLNSSFFLLILLFYCSILFSQDSTCICRVELNNLKGTYKGECKNGFAHGNGEATGADHYVGLFKNGLPHGKGIYYYSNLDNYNGSFQNGIKEGKGEAHYQREGKPDSVVKGYWSADEYRGKTYKTYSTAEMPFFDRVEIVPSGESGNMLTIETSSTTGMLNYGYVLTVIDVVATDGSFINKQETSMNPAKYFASYRLSKFPVRVRITLSNGKAFNLELYKNANWSVKLFLNR